MMFGLLGLLRKAAFVAVLLVLAGSPLCLRAQRLPTATAPGSYIAIGATASDYRVPYGQQTNLGYSVFADVNLTRHIGIEGEGRRLWFNTDEGTRSSTYLVGPRYSIVKKRFRPYAKVLFGQGKFTFPFAEANGSYFVIAPGAGLDISVLHSRAFLRVVDFEYQDWQNFTYGANHPYGISAGLSIRVF